MLINKKCEGKNPLPSANTDITSHDTNTSKYQKGRLFATIITHDKNTLQQSQIFQLYLF